VREGAPRVRSPVRAQRAWDGTGAWAPHGLDGWDPARQRGQGPPQRERSQTQRVSRPWWVRPAAGLPAVEPGGRRGAGGGGAPSGARVPAYAWHQPWALPPGDKRQSLCRKRRTRDRTKIPRIERPGRRTGQEHRTVLEHPTAVEVWQDLSVGFVQDGAI